MRDIITALGAQTIILKIPRRINGASTVCKLHRGDGSPWRWCRPELSLGQSSSPSIPALTFPAQSSEGLDYEAIYILDSTVFGGSDWGRLTTTVNWHLAVPG